MVTKALTIKTQHARVHFPQNLLALHVLFSAIVKGLSLEIRLSRLESSKAG
jgi:hypothetical protein